MNKCYASILPPSQQFAAHKNFIYDLTHQKVYSKMYTERLAVLAKIFIKNKLIRLDKI